LEVGPWKLAIRRRRVHVQERLQKILSAAGVASRRAAETLITQGRVAVNGATVLDLGSKADPQTDTISVDGRRIKTAVPLRYVLVNKPTGMVTTRSDPERRPTVLELVPQALGYLYPVGRLDYDSEGLLLLTNDGELAARLTHPSHAVARVYEARVLGSLDERDLQRLARGIEFDGHRTAPAEIERLSDRSDRTTSRPPRSRTAESSSARRSTAARSSASSTRAASARYCSA
jgi:23S rRNA pseudouridine2605 synthase